MRILFCLLGVLASFSVLATPPEYATFKRTQKINPDINESELLRIWVAYVGQGDGILIELPESYDVLVFDEELNEEVAEPANILVDAGSSKGSDKNRTRDLIQALYPDGSYIEHLVISHHDQDHVWGVSPILAQEEIIVENVYHNGLASYLPTLGAPIDGIESPGDCGTDGAVSSKDRRGEISRWMGCIDSGNRINGHFLINNLEEVAGGKNQNLFQGVYKRLVDSLFENDNAKVNSFERVTKGDQILDTDHPGLVSIDVLWPNEDAGIYNTSSRRWGYTINGNSVTLRLDYGDFSMLLSGDHNEKSLNDMFAVYTSTNELDKLTEIDVLKAPHHGSDKVTEALYRTPRAIGRSTPNAVLTVASMGIDGFLGRFRHPRENPIQWSGGAHRFYSTAIHEKRFTYHNTSKTELRKLIEEKHILIETDGTWFRVVEVDPDDALNIPTVSEVTRSHGTRWICARSLSDCKEG